MDYQDFTGRLDAVKSVDIRARVSGYITEVPFKEGDHVKENELLFQIDVRPYQADLNQAQRPAVMRRQRMRQQRRRAAGRECDQNQQHRTAAGGGTLPGRLRSGGRVGAATSHSLARPRRAPDAAGNASRSRA